MYFLFQVLLPVSECSNSRLLPTKNLKKPTKPKADKLGAQPVKF